MKRWFAAMLLSCLLIGSVNAESSHVFLIRQVCGDFTSRLKVGDYALVTSPALNFRNAPNTHADRVRDPLEPGTLVSIDKGPQCVDSYTWWQITANHLQGWVAEGNPDKYFLSPPVDPSKVVQQNTNTGTGSSGNANPNPPLATLDARPGGGNYDYACRGVSDDELTGRDPSTSSNVDNGASLRFSPSLNMLEVDTPAICLGANYGLDGNEVAFGPDGRSYTPVITPVYRDVEDDGSGGELDYTQVQLPSEAFNQFGRWQLQASGFSLDVDIRAPSHPYVLYTFADNGEMIVGAMQPNERFIANGTGNDGDSTYHFEAQVNGAGVFVIPLAQLPWFNDLSQYDTNSLYASVTETDIIGQQGSFVTLDGVTVRDPVSGYDWFRIPVRYAAPLMHEIVWGGNYDEAGAENLLRSWTCPGAAPIQLNQNENESATASGDAQAIYSQPSVNSQVQETVQPGDTIFLLDGVECGDNGVWWESNDGWLLESRNGQYLWTP
ncbi:MAG: hypothetical protein ABI700_07380 [Chloroflexota bacterium]